MGQDEALQLDHEQAADRHAGEGQRLTPGNVRVPGGLGVTLVEERPPAPDRERKPAGRHEQERKSGIADAGGQGDDGREEENQVRALCQRQGRSEPPLALELRGRDHRGTADRRRDEDHCREQGRGMVGDRADPRETDAGERGREERLPQKPRPRLQAAAIDNAVQAER
jgi:hypothetical protein